MLQLFIKWLVHVLVSVCVSCRRCRARSVTTDRITASAASTPNAARHAATETCEVDPVARPDSVDHCTGPDLSNAQPQLDPLNLLGIKSSVSQEYFISFSFNKC